MGAVVFFALFWKVSSRFSHIFAQSDTWTSNFRYFLEVACFGSWGSTFLEVVLADQPDEFRLESVGAVAFFVGFTTSSYLLDFPFFSIKFWIDEQFICVLSFYLTFL